MTPASAAGPEVTAAELGRRESPLPAPGIKEPAGGVAAHAEPAGPKSSLTPPEAETLGPRTDTTPPAELPAKVLPPERKIRELGGARAPREMKARPQPKLAQPKPLGIPLATPPSKPAVTGKEQKKPPEKKTQTPIQRFSKEILDEARKKVLRPEDILEPKKKVSALVIDEEEDGRDKKKKAGIGDRKQRKQAREERAKERRAQGQLVLDVTVEEDLRTRIGRRQKKARAPATQPRHSKVVLEPPVTVRSLSEALGLKAVQLLFRLRDHGQVTATINSTVEPAVAEMLALETGSDLEIKRPPDAEDRLIDSLTAADNADDLVPRGPVVTVMGHVDHGKTSLLDRIRKSNVAATEAGGITQVIRAWRVEHDNKFITFLDTPGHEAFTKMRARGAQVTDIAVIVVAADDGVMPQTEEAINHAKAAGVSLVVAINKVDLPNANVERTKQQLFGQEILPDNMGGDTPFVETSAATGKGINELLESILLVAELKELKANPSRPARGVCLEAMLSEGEGVLATLLVQNGTLRKGDVVLCGASYGRIRQMYNDLGRSIEEAGPSVPVRITGLDFVPNADDPFYIVPDLATAREIAEKRKGKQREAAQTPRTPLDLSRLGQVPIQKLNVILKADFRGSIEAIRKELEKLKHAEVEVHILRAAIGGVSESDVLLAMTSPQDTMILGFNVVPDDRARALAEERGIPIRQYNVIYMLTDDVRAALEGKLKPRQEVIHLGRAVVRETFKVSRVGTIAGCYVTQGIIRRSAKVRLIRDGVVIFPPADKNVGLDSLKRFKDDVSEVREGFECGLKIAGYDDVKVGDVIEAYRIEEVQRTLDQA
jgi:translation initiation factor IF-2